MKCNKEDIIYGLKEVQVKIAIVSDIIESTSDILDIEEECNKNLSSEWFEKYLGAGQELSAIIELKIVKSGEDKNGFWMHFRNFFENWDNSCLSEKIDGIEEMIYFDEERKKDVSKQYKEKKKDANKGIKEERNNKVIALAESGKTKVEIANEQKISTKTVERILGWDKQ